MSFAFDLSPGSSFRGAVVDLFSLEDQAPEGGQVFLSSRSRNYKSHFLVPATLVSAFWPKYDCSLPYNMDLEEEAISKTCVAHVA